MHKIRPGGFTLIELLISIAIFSITLTFGISSYRTWVLGSQIRNAAESISNGMQHTRAEAVKRNTNVAFVLGAASAWQISVPSIPGVSGVVETRPSSEGSKNVAITVTPGGATTITYSNLGTVALNGDGSATLSQIDLDSSLAVSGVRALRVAIGVGGDPRVCDPSPAITNKSPPDPRRCY